MPVIGGLLYLLKYKQRIVDDIVVNMVDVGEETGELDTMLYKVADTYDEEVAVLTEGLTKLMEPLLIIFLGGAVGFIVIALFKGRIILGILGFMVPLLAFVAALRLARPRSPWARRYSGAGTRRRARVCGPG